MIRSHLVALTLLFLASPVSASEDEAPSDVEIIAEAEAEADHEYDEEYDEDEMEFCGGEETIVDLAWYELEENPAEARDILVEALRGGEIEPWLRPQALVTLAEAQLRLGKPSAAVRNYQKAIDLDEAAAGEGARVGLAVALMLQTRRKAAFETASSAAPIVCTNRYSQVACYALRVVLGRTSRDPAARAEAQASAQALREANEPLLTSFDAIDDRLTVAAR